MKLNENVVNEESRRAVMKEFGKSEKWRNYAERITKNPFVAKYLMDKYGGVCQYCGLPIRGNMQIQHKDYSKECVTENTIRVAHPTPNRTDGTRKAPDCEHCDKFHECVDDSLFPVHAKCNMLISRSVLDNNRSTRRKNYVV